MTASAAPSTGSARSGNGYGVEVDVDPCGTGITERRAAPRPHDEHSLPDAGESLSAWM